MKHFMIDEAGQATGCCFNIDEVKTVKTLVDKLLDGRNRRL